MFAFVSIVGANREKLTNNLTLWKYGQGRLVYPLISSSIWSSVVELSFYFFYGAGDFFLEYYDYKTLSWSLILYSSEDFEISVLYTVFCFLQLSIWKIFVGITDAWFGKSFMCMVCLFRLSFDFPFFTFTSCSPSSMMLSVSKDCSNCFEGYIPKLLWFIPWVLCSSHVL